MRIAIPPIREHVDDLKYRLQREHDWHTEPRLQMLYLLASGQAGNRQEVAALLEVHRNTLGRWLAIDAAGGLDALQARYVPAGQPIALAPAELASLKQVLRRPEGFAPYEGPNPTLTLLANSS
jgi:transposase